MTTQSRIHPEYTRKCLAAADMADAAWLKGGLDAMQDELGFLRGSDADPVVIGEYERLYHRMVKRLA
jgi:hypothetical protein